MTALSWALCHPANRERRIRTLLTWVTHNVRRRVTPEQILVLPFGEGIMEGPASHPVMCLIRYVHGGLYDYDAMRALDVVLDGGVTFIDVGANIGSYSVLAGHKIGATGRVLAFEPATTQAAMLARNLAKTPAQAAVYPIALADKQRKVSFVAAGATTQYLSATSGGYELTTSTLDDEIRSCEPGSFAKLDVEGWEPAVIAGAEQWLDSEPRGLLIEANGLSRRSPVPWKAAVGMLHQRGLEFVWPDFAAGVLHRFANPDPVSPFDNYLVLTRPLSEKLLAAVNPVPEAG